MNYIHTLKIASNYTQFFWQAESISNLIAKDTGTRVACRYVNSQNPVLMKAARRALLNRKLFGFIAYNSRESGVRGKEVYMQSIVHAIAISALEESEEGHLVYPQSYKAFRYN